MWTRFSPIGPAREDEAETRLGVDMGDVLDHAMPERLLADTEEDWAYALGGVSLVAEAEVDHNLAIQALRGVRDLGLARLRDWPACIAVGMVAIAAEDYEAGSYWGAFFDHLAERQDQHVQSAFGDAFLASLDRFGLPYDVDGGLTYLGPLTLHAAVPTYCLADLLVLLVQRDRMTVGLDGEAFVAWATGIGAPTRLNSLDVPVRRFLQFGGEFAVDMVDRLLEMLRALKSGEVDLQWTGLPRRIIHEARRSHASGALHLTASQTTRRRSATQRDVRPTLGLNVVAGTVVVRLPSVGEAPDGRAVWRVALDGDVQRIASTALWPGSLEPAPATEAIVRRPVRSASISLEGSELVSNIDIVDAQDPLLIFGENGQVLPASSALPRGQVWVLHPDDVSLEATGQVDTVAESVPPLGWAGWTLRLVSLDAADWLRAKGRKRWVRRTRQARFEFPEPLVGITTPYGSPVYGEPPVVHLPGSSESSATWSVTVHESGSGRVLHTTQYEVAALADVRADPFEQLQRPLLGSFDVTVRGRLGSGQERSFVVVEGLRPRLSRVFRAFTHSGLASTTVHLATDGGLSVSSQEFILDENDLSRIFEVYANDAQETLHLTPPHMKVARVSTSQPGQWSRSPLRETTESLSDAGRLIISVPAQVAPSLRVRVAGHDVQEIDPSGRRIPGQVSYELARVADTIRAHGRADLVIDTDNVSVPVAFFQPGSLATGCTIDGGELVLENFVGVEDVSAGLYACLAPWRDPFVVSIDFAGYAFLPEEYVDAGPMLVSVRLNDPWSPQPWPSWPSGPSTFLVEQSGSPRFEDAGESAVVHYLCGVAEIPRDEASLAYLWHVLHRRKAVKRGGVRRDIRGDVEAAFRRRPEWALASLLDSGLDAADVVTLVIETGMPYYAPSIEPATLQRLWQLYPVVACLSGVRSSELPLDEIETTCGSVALTVLSGDDDPYRKSGVFDAMALQMAAMSKDQVDAIWSAARIVPGGLLDADSRVAAARELFDARSHPRLREVIEVGGTVLDGGKEIIGRAGVSQRTLDWLDSRRGDATTPAWINLPALSSIFAVLARRAARGNAACREFVERGQRYWRALAKRAPALVTTDIILAELLERGYSDPIIQTEDSDGEEDY